MVSVVSVLIEDSASHEDFLAFFDGRIIDLSCQLCHALDRDSLDGSDAHNGLHEERSHLDLFEVLLVLLTDRFCALLNLLSLISNL